MKSKILLCGAEIALDNTLRGLIDRHAHLSVLEEVSRFAAMTRADKYDLIVFEFTEDWQHDLELVRTLRVRSPHSAILIVDGGTERAAVIRAFKVGAKDYFKKPYDAFLLAERVEALVKSHGNA